MGGAGDTFEGGSGDVGEGTGGMPTVLGGGGGGVER